MIKTEYEKIEPYTTKDGSTIRELLHPSEHGAELRMSLAEDRVSPEKETTLHRHPHFQEIYHFLEGEGEMRLGNARFHVAAGDSVFIPAGTPHNVRNTAAIPLRFLCCCVPPYAHDGTELIEPTQEDSHGIHDLS